MQGLRWDDLRGFLAVARHGTLASAAEDLGVNASTVHRRIAALEEALEARLFVRDPRGYSLTGVGEALVPRAEEVEEAVLSLERTATGHDRTAQGPVTLTLPETLVALIVPTLAEVRELCPGLRPILRAEDRILDVGTDADVALRPSFGPPRSAVGRKLGPIAWAVYGPAHTEAELPWVLYSSDAGPAVARSWQEQHHGSEPALLEVSTVGAMHRVLGCARAQGLLPCYLGDPDGRLERRTAPIEALQNDLWLLIHADLRRSARVRALVDLLVPRLESARSLLAGEGDPERLMPYGLPS